MSSPFCSIVPFNDNQKEMMNRALDTIIRKLENNESLIPTDEEVEDAIKKSIDGLKELKTPSISNEAIPRVDGFYHNTVDKLKSYDFNEKMINHILNSARWIRENQRCPSHVSLRMYQTFIHPDLSQYIEMIHCLVEECNSLEKADYQFRKHEKSE